MGILYELYNFTRKEYTNIGKYSVNTKDWTESPLANYYMFMIRRFWMNSDDIQLIPDTRDTYYDLRENFKDITEESVNQYNEEEYQYNEQYYHDGKKPKINKEYEKSDYVKLTEENSQIKQVVERLKKRLEYLHRSDNRRFAKDSLNVKQDEIEAILISELQSILDGVEK